jgi:starvation-inducible outer membrane lipoprotein
MAIKKLLVLAGALALAGCAASPSEVQCRYANVEEDEFSCGATQQRIAVPEAAPVIDENS